MNRKGFTLIELMVLIAIMGIILTVALVVFVNKLNAAERGPGYVYTYGRAAGSDYEVMIKNHTSKPRHIWYNLTWLVHNKIEQPTPGDKKYDAPVDGIVFVGDKTEGDVRKLKTIKAAALKALAFQKYFYLKPGESAVVHRGSCRGCDISWNGQVTYLYLSETTFEELKKRLKQYNPNWPNV